VDVRIEEDVLFLQAGNWRRGASQVVELRQWAEQGPAQAVPCSAMHCGGRQSSPLGCRGCRTP